MTGGPDVSAFLERLREIAAGWESAHDSLESMRVVAVSRDRLATATADSGGAVVELVLAADLRDHGPETVAASILEATARAVTEANARRAELVSGSVALAVGGRRRAAEDVARQLAAAPTAGRGTG